jgi:two-component system, LytTR family, sensor histidine kinase LytS
MITKQFDWTELFNKRNKLYTQGVFWLMVFILYIILKEYPRNVTGIVSICIVLQETLELAIPCYSQNLLILPFFKRRKWVIGIILYVVQIILLIWLLPYILNMIGFIFAKLFHMQSRVDWTQEHIAFSVVAFTIVATAFKIALDKLMRDKEQKEAELKHLKAQLNPHFLFNTLNNLYGLSVVESKKLPELMLKLSDLLRYTLYETNQTYVSLQKELTYITNYVELEKIRLGDKTWVEFDIEGDFSDQSIAPLLLIVFIENGFKHYSAPRNQRSFVQIHFRLQDQVLHLRVRNSLDALLFNERKSPQRGGIGLANTRQRLGLLYPQKHTLLVAHEQEYYEVDLKINLSRS